MHTLDWYGNAWYSSTIRVGGASYAEGKPLATTEYVDNHISTKIDIISHDVEVLKRAAHNSIYTMITTATEENPVLINDGVMMAANISSIGPGIIEEVINFAPISEDNYFSSAAIILDANNGIIKIPAGDYSNGDVCVDMVLTELLGELEEYFCKCFGFLEAANCCGHCIHTNHKNRKTNKNKTCILSLGFVLEHIEDNADNCKDRNKR
jgi:hypothetical protein